MTLSAKSKSINRPWLFATGPVLLLMLIFLSSCATVPTGHDKPADKEDLMEQLDRSYLREYYPATINLADQIINHDNNTRNREKAYYFKGLSLLKEERFEEARESFRKLVQFSPRSSLADESLMGIGDSYFIEADYDNSQVAYQNLLRSYPNSTLLNQVYYKIGRIFEKKGEWNQAKTYYSRLVSDFPESYEATLVKDTVEDNQFYFTVQVGSFANETNARRLRDQLKKDGYSAYLAEKPNGQGVFYRVRVGRLKERADAEELSRLLRKDGFPTKIYP